MSAKDLGFATEILVMTIAISVILLFMGIGVLMILIHVCIVGRAFRGLGNNIASETGSAGRPSMSRDDIEKLPCHDYMEKNKGSSPVNCAICLDSFEVGNKCRLLPMCKHSFHAQCVDAWLLKTPICPICRASADSRRAGIIIDEVNSHFSDTSFSIDTRASQTTESSHFSDASIEFREGQPTESSLLTSAVVNELRESQTTEGSDVIIEVRQSQRESTQVNNAGTESTQNQAYLIRTQSTSNPSLDSTSEHPV